MKNEPDQKFKNKYRIPSTRLQNYDYGQNGMYFVTICTKNHEHFFGKIMHDRASHEMQYSDIGKIAQKCWLAIPHHFPFVIMGEWVVMPNHVHGVLIFDKRKSHGDTIVHGDPIVETPNLGVSTPTPTPTPTPTITSTSPMTKNINPHWKSGDLGVIINQYKRACTIASRKINFNFAWQSRFHDHIIRNEHELNRISKYIVSNPQNWENSAAIIDWYNNMKINNAENVPKINILNKK